MCVLFCFGGFCLYLSLVNVAFVTLPEIKMNKLLSSEEVFRLRDHRHGELMLQGARLQHVEGCLADQYRLSMLDGPHWAHCETATISYAVHLVEHWNLRVPWKTTQNTVHGSWCGQFPALFTWLWCDYDETVVVFDSLWTLSTVQFIL